MNGCQKKEWEKEKTCLISLKSINQEASKVKGNGRGISFTRWREPGRGGGWEVGSCIHRITRRKVSVRRG